MSSAVPSNPSLPGQAASGGYAALLVVVRGRPSLESDAGIFLSVAGRLLDGDRLYVDVLDNKDPLFYYSHAAALASRFSRLISAIECPSAASPRR